MSEDRDELLAPVEVAGWRLDQFLANSLAGVSRSRVQQLVAEGRVLVDGRHEKASLKLRGGEAIVVIGEQQTAPLEAKAEEIPLDVVYEDEYLAVIHKPAGMMVHAGSGATEEQRSSGTLVNALMHRFPTLSTIGGELRPGIVHRLDKETSGLIVIARDDRTHEALASMFATRQITKTYITLVQGFLPQDHATIQAAISRDSVRRTRMTTKRSDNARSAVSHYRVVERLETRFGKFTLARVRIETGRTHQIRIHMSSISHPVVGDTLYGAAGKLVAQSANARRKAVRETLELGRNFLHAAELAFVHPVTGKEIQLVSALPPELESFLAKLREPAHEQGPEASNAAGSLADSKTKSGNPSRDW
ncbi:RluA family pseudouridine synthase [Acidicapsa dinghuensis]|uniref:Pseudouridine synthase n=1 Tax=Acidicapsa dinghuensis TaxID=2218256 RepID=A0ABW1EF52_9BACT|nr:RluA family pseudouridine synthase [Acidicapsa dinghuensis]